MFPLKIARKLAFLPIFASIILAALPLRAQNPHNPVHEVAQLAGMHCQLWLHWIQQDYRADRPPNYDAITGEPLLPEEQAYLHEATLGGLPDFGFVIGKRWEFATRNERHQFNLGFLRLLNREFDLQNEESGKYCGLDVSLTLQDPEPNNSDFVELPQPRLYLAEASALLPSMPRALPVHYYMRQDLSGWIITDISLGSQSLWRRYGESFNRMLAAGGYQRLNDWLTGPKATPLQPQPAPPAPKP